MATRKPKQPAAALAPIIADLERMAQDHKSLREELARERAQRLELVREHERVLLQLARAAESAVEARAAPEHGDLVQHGRVLERERQTLTLEVARLRKREADLVAELERARAEQTVAQEERACLEEQIAHLKRLITLLTGENRLLRRKHDSDAPRR